LGARVFFGADANPPTEFRQIRPAPLATITIRTADAHRESFVSGVARDAATGLTADLGALFS